MVSAALTLASAHACKFSLLEADTLDFIQGITKTVITVAIKAIAVSIIGVISIVVFIILITSSLEV